MKRKLLFVGPVLTASGYGVHARQLLRALHASDSYDITVESLRWGETPFLSDPDLEWIRQLAAKPAHLSPDLCVQVTIPNEFKRRATLMIGVTAGIEVDRVSPHWIMKCNDEVDLVVVPSEHSKRAFMVEYQGQDGSKLALNRPIVVIHEGVDRAIYYPNPTLSPLLDKLDVPAKNFVFTGLGLDKPSGKDRKNVTSLIEYFCRTFDGNKNVGLILKVSIVNGSTVDFELVKRRIKEIKKSIGVGEFPKISLIHGRLSESEMAGIYNDPRVLAAVSLTHGEGFGLPLIEAAACGLPVMATNWSGHLDFLQKDGNRLFVPFDFDMEEIPAEVVWEGVMERGTRWATVRAADVQTKLQKMVLSSETPRKWALELSTHLHDKFSLEATGQTFLRLIEAGVAELDTMSPQASEDRTATFRNRVRSLGPSLIYTMPMSAGDVFLSTGVVKALRDKHPGHRVFFATQKQYFDILSGFDGIDEMLEWQPWMQDPAALETIFDQVYTPNLNVQMQWANWIHGGKGRNLVDEFAAQCNVVAQAPHITQPSGVFQGRLPGTKVVTIHTGGQKSARAWAHWTELVKNLRSNGIKVRQIGAADDISVGDVDYDMRGKTNHTGLIAAIADSACFLGIDSYPMHVAASIDGMKVVAIFGSSYPGSTGPKDLGEVTDRDLLVDRGAAKLKRLRLLETTDRNGCERACYKDTCRIDSANPCLNNIKPSRVFDEVLDALGHERIAYKEYRPKIAGYTHILNPKTHGYPFIQSIGSMIGFCDEVIVVDGGSTDGSIEDLRNAGAPAIKSGQLKIITREWDPNEPGMDGMQKAFGRAMVSSGIDFLWQQDADEIVHERDYAKILDLCKRFPKDVDLIHLPVIELWGDSKHVRTDRHSWKWRLSRNNIRITHGIATQARLTDPKSGRIYAKPGQSDGCEMIDMVSGEHLPHRGFYTKELEQIRVSNPAEYGRIMNTVFEQLPSVWHYSWADLPRKIRNFRDFWDKQWQVLYQTPPEPRFPDVATDDDIERKATELLAQGGEHGQAKTFELALDEPNLMKVTI